MTTARSVFLAGIVLLGPLTVGGLGGTAAATNGSPGGVHGTADGGPVSDRTPAGRVPGAVRTAGGPGSTHSGPPDRPDDNGTDDRSRDGDVVESRPDRRLGAPDAAVPGFGPVSTLDDASTAQVTHRYDLTPSKPGSIRLVVDYRIPDSYDRFLDYVRNDETVLSVRGFTRSGDVLKWDGETTNPRLELRIRINGTGNRFYDRVDTGQWAFFVLRSLDYSNANVSVTTVSDDWSIAHGEFFAFLGNQSTKVYRGSRQRFRVVVPDAADPSVSPDRVFEELDRASRLLEFGPRTVDREVTVWILPDPMRSGGAAVDSEFWVHQDSNFWRGSTYIHEYVHTRQTNRNGRKDDDLSLTYRGREATGWLTEATASFYGSLTNWRLDNRASFADVRSDATVPADVVLANSSTYGGEDPGYGQGEGVVVALDYRIRKATDGNASFQDVLRRMIRRQDEVDAAEMQRIVEDVAGRDFDRFFDRYVYAETDPPAPPHPGPYRFVDTATVRQPVDGPSPGRGRVVVTTWNLTIYSSDPGLPSVYDYFGAYAVVVPEPDGSVRLPVERLEGTRFDEYAVSYVQATPNGVRFPRDGVADLAVLGSVDSLPFRGSVEDLDGATRKTVTVVDTDGDPVSGTKVRVGVVEGATNSRVALRTNGRGQFLNRNGTRGIELVGRSKITLENPPAGFPYQRVSGVLPADRALDTRFVVRRNVPDLYVAGTAVPQSPSVGNATIYLFVNPDDPGTGIVRKVYVDGESVGSVRIPPRNEYEAWVVAANVSFEESGTHTLRVGGVPARTVTVGDVENSPPRADAGPDTTVTSGSRVFLDAGNSSDPEGDSLSYSWTRTGGPSVSLRESGTATPEFVAPSVDTTTTLTFRVTVTDGRKRDTDRINVTVEPGGSELQLDVAPEEVLAPPGSNATARVVLRSLPNGLGNFQLQLRVRDPSTATVANVSIAGDPQFARVTGLDDGDGNVTVTAVWLGEGRTRTGDVPLATVTLAGRSRGETPLNVTVIEIRGVDNNPYSGVNTDPTRINVSDVRGVDLNGNGRVSSDVDGDGVHEDVSGDGRATTADVVALFENLGAAADDPALFDVTGDGRVTTADVVALFEELTS